MATFKDDEQEKKLGELHRKEEEELARMLSDKYGVGYTDLSEVSIDTNALRLIGEEEARAAQVAGFEKIGNKIGLAARSPESDATKEVLRDLEDRGYEVTLYMVSEQSLERAWEHYADLSYAVESKAGVLDISGEEVRKTIEQMGTLEEVHEEIQSVLQMDKAHRISRILETVLAGGLATKASDIHIEPGEGDVRLRFRLDGVLTDILTIDYDTYELLLSRIKLLSRLKLNVKNEAQDGRFSVKLDTEEIEIRTSTLPGSNGESIVMRLLDPASIALSMERLGMDEHLQEAVAREIKRPNGMILTTGPTGSGKTTTLYAFLKKIHTPDIKIITIENPVEYHLSGIVQTQIEKDHYSFIDGLRSALRQDPDVIMIGEIRTEEVAKTAVNAALTGHIVFSTLHTNTAAGTFPRLIELGVDPKIMGSAINIALAQRLVRELCSDCKQAVPLEGAKREQVESIVAGIVDTERAPDIPDVIYEAVGCDACDNTGFRGRIGIFEAVHMDETIEALVREQPSERDILKAARPQGFFTMPQDGIVKVIRGITSLAELERVVDIARETMTAE